MSNSVPSIDCLYQETPTIRSNKLSQLNGRSFYLKLDNCQASGSFKLRGLGHMILKSHKANKIENLITSSGGNAGLAAAYSGQTLGIKTTVVTPKTTSDRVITDLKNFGAEVLVHGDVWDESEKKALELSRTLPGAFYVPPFDHPLVWEGNATIVDEAVRQMNGLSPDCVIVSVGGGGMALGVIQGMLKHGWMDAGVKLIMVETVGADCFNQSVKADRVVTLESITSIAKTLGAKKCADRLFELWKVHQKQMMSIVVTDKQAVEACCRFLDDHQILVEPSCGASLAVAYDLDNYLTHASSSWPPIKNVLVEVCGGTSLNLETLLNFKKSFQIP